jgi:hypothetical protein
MASLKGAPSFWRPSRVLGLLFWIAIFLGPSLVLWQWSLRGPTNSYVIDKAQIAVLLAAWAAGVGWIVTAWTSIRNSVKQHTVNTLLQSRLSQTYMGYADKVNEHFASYESAHPLKTRDLQIDPAAGIDQASLRYILNYFEYVAIGIRYGDLHEQMLCASLRSILTRTAYYSRFWIGIRVLGNETKPANPRMYVQLRWLYGRWRDEDSEDLLPTDPTNPIWGDHFDRFLLFFRRKFDRNTERQS